MRISVIIPTHNRSLLLPRALDSVLSQSRQADEVIVVDDGSTDDTAAMLRDRYPRVRYLFQGNRGVSAARNLGIRAATGDWIALLDSDDSWLPDKLERQEVACSTQPGYRIVHGEEIWIRDGRRVNPKRRHDKHGGWIFNRCLPLCVISPSAVMIQRDLLLEVGLFDETLPACEDYDLWLRLCAFHPVLFLKDPVIRKYGGHAGQLSRKYPALDRFRLRALEKVIVGPEFSDQQRRLALGTWREKKQVYRAGAEKRGRDQEVADLDQREVELCALLSVPGTGNNPLSGRGE